MIDACTIILQDRSYCVDGRYAEVIRTATHRGDFSVVFETMCDCGSEKHTVTVPLGDIVRVIHHGATPEVEQTLARASTRRFADVVQLFRT